ncbi:hypothetical protein [uncultured Pseudodesulfovibrio sp.]|uniref:hypothetical protein n=1 Tax=uncultured Pseudodesulfovibrio sp. TaxID=2035858 RepID=UPI0029C8B7C6|nr:hypothetical protein [uncultured Pseudodesulfovibrio sp.]
MLWMTDRTDLPMPISRVTRLSSTESEKLLECLFSIYPRPIKKFPVKMIIPTATRQTKPKVIGKKIFQDKIELQRSLIVTQKLFANLFVSLDSSSN